LILRALLAEPVVERAAFEVQDLLELATEVVHDAAQVELIEAFAALLS
jgi:hypothetical protein